MMIAPSSDPRVVTNFDLPQSRLVAGTSATLLVQWCCAVPLSRLPTADQTPFAEMSHSHQGVWANVSVFFYKRMSMGEQRAKANVEI
jgi:hypothetical protein